MNHSNIATILDDFRIDAAREHKNIREYIKCSPLLRAKNIIQNQIQQEEHFRVSILKNISTFSSLSHEQLKTAAQSMEEIFYEKGDHVIQQEELGDSVICLD